MSDLHGPDRNNLPTVAGGPIPPAKRADPPADAAAGSADCPQASDQPSDPQTADAAEKPDQRTLGPDSDTVAVPGPCGFSGSDGSGGTVRAPVAASDPAASDSGSFRSTRLGFLFAALAAVAAWLRARFRRTASFSQEPLADRLSEESIQTIAPAAPPRSGGSGGSGGSAALRETPAFPPDSPTIPMSPAGSTLSEQGTSGFTSRQIGQYLLLAKLGEGAMGVVYRARQTDLRRDVALKMLHPDQETEDRRRRFLEEARSAARLRHANFVHVYDLGTADGHVFIAMELVEGGTLADRLRQSRPTFWQAAQEVLTLARAMQTAHEAGIVHRDIKPSNVMVTADGQLKISDFGLARRLDAQVRQTAAGKLLGTPAYMAPEQARGENDAVGPATDVYALGAVLYELLTGRTPFRARSVPEVLRLIVEADPVPPDRIATGSCRPPRDLATICLKCLSKKPGQRYGSAAALAEDLERFLAGLPVLARPVGRLERLRRRICRHPWHFATAALLLVGAVIAGGGVWNHLQYHRESVSHFRDYSVRWQVIEGLHPISASEAARRYQSVRITRKGYRGPVIRAEIVDGAGRPHPHEWLIESSLRPTAPGAEQQVVTVEYPGRTAENDRVVDAIAYNRQGHRVWAMHFTDYPYTCHYTFSSRLGSSAGGTPRPPAAGQSGGQRGGERAQDRGLHPVFTAMVIGASPARFIQFEYRDDGSGLASRELFFDERDRTVMPQPNADGAYGFQYEYDARGNVVVLRQLNAEYREGPNDIGVSRKVFTHYPNGERKSERYFHGERPVIPLNHITAGLDYEYDEQGNPIRVHLRNAEGERPDEPGRAAYFVHEFGPNGELLSRSLRDVRGTKNVSLDQDLLDEYGFGAAREQRWKYADDGTITQVRFVDENGELVAAGEGVAGWNSEYQDGFEIRRVCVAPDGKPPARTTAGNLGWTAVYEDGRLVSKTYFGYEIGSPKAREDYDRDGNIIRTRYLANDEKTLMSDIDGTAGWDATFEGGHEAKREWVGTDGKSPQRNKYDTLGYTSRYTDGQLVSQTYFGYRSGSPKLQNMFDREGNIVSVRRLANDEKTLIVEDDGIAGWDNTYQDGTLTKCVWVGPDGKPPQRNTSGSLGYTADYVDGRLASQTYFGYEEGFGISAQRDEFDEEGNRIRGRYLAADGESFTIHPQEGIAGWNSTFENGLETERVFVDQNGNPGIRGNQGAIGWKATYANGVLVSKLSYGYVGDAPKVRSEFDVEGNLIRQRYLADDEQTLVIDPDHGTAGCDITIEDGQQVECVWVGPNGKPPWRHNLGHLGFKSEYREGRLSSKTYFGYSAEAGRAMQREELDAAGNVVRVRYLAEDGKTAVIKPDERIAGWNSTFENGREVKQVYVGLDGQPPQHHSDGSQGYTKSYDGNRAISQTYFGFKEGYLWRDELDAAGNIFRTSFLGKDGITPIVHPVYGIASWKSYYEGGAQVRREHFDLKGQPIRTLAVVEEVFPGSQAAAKGVKVGDLFLEYDGVRGSAMELIHAVRKAGQQTGEPVMVKFLRKGEVLTREFARGTVGIRAQDFAVDRLKESEPERVPPAEQTTAVQPGVFRETDRRNSELVTGVRSRVF